MPGPYDDLTPYSRPPAAVADPDPVSRPKTRTRQDVSAFLKLARDRFQQGQDADTKQRERELADLKFAALDYWPEDVKTAREGQNASNGLPPTPARPCLVIDKTTEPLRQVLNQERGSDISIELVAADDFGDGTAGVSDDEIDLREGLIRRIQRESEAHDARTWAFDRAVKAGRGYYVIGTRYAQGKTRDQEIYVRRLYNQACVTIDPTHEQPDGSDAEWGFIGTDLPWDQYKAEHPKAANGRPNPVLEAGDDVFRALGEQYPTWFRSEGKTRLVRVVEYYYTERTTRTLAMLPDGRDEWEDELSESDKAQDYDTRPVIETKVKWAKIDGTQVLDETDWPGHYIPIIQVLGEEQQPYDDQRRAFGMIRGMRESVYGFSVMASRVVEAFGLSPLPSLQVAEGQIEGYEAWYQAATTRTLPYLPYKQRDLESNPAPPPTLVPRDLGAVIGPLTQSLAMFNEAIQSATSIHDPNLGKDAPNARSGRAILALQQQGNQGTSNYLDNLSRSMRYEGRIINDLLEPIYNRPGRIARIVNGEGDSEAVMLHQPFTRDSAGRPIAAPPDSRLDTQHYTLTKDATFNVVVRVTRSADTRRFEEQELVGTIINADPQAMTIVGDLFFEHQDGPGHQAMADRFKAVLDPRVQAMLAQQQHGAPTPQQVQQMQAQIQQLTAQLQQAAGQLNSETAKYQAQAQIEQFKQQAAAQMKQLELAADADLQVRLKQMDNAAKIEVARIAAAKQAADTVAEASEEQQARGHEAVQNALDRQHDRRLAVAQQQHDAAQAAQHQQAAQQQQQTQVAADQQAQASDQIHQATMASQSQENANAQGADTQGAGGV